MRRLAVIGSLCVAIGLPSVTHAQTLPRDPATESARKSSLGLRDINAKPWTGDLDGMVKRRVIRVLVPYSKRPAPPKLVHME